jgi:hypothetical protein
MEAKKYLEKIGISDQILNREDLQEYWKSISQLMEEFAALRQPPVVGRSESFVCGRDIKSCVFYDKGKCSLPTDVIELLKRAKTFVPLYMPTKAHNEHNQLGLDLIKCFEKYGIEWRQ